MDSSSALYVVDAVDDVVVDVVADDMVVCFVGEGQTIHDEMEQFQQPMKLAVAVHVS